MPNKQGFDTLTLRGATVLRCVWCGELLRPWDTEGKQARHARKHVGDAADAKAASDAEFKLAAQVVNEEVD